MKVNFQFLAFLDLYYKKSTQFALKKVNSTHWSMFRSTREYMQPVHFFKILNNTVHTFISINNIIFKHLSAKNLEYIDCRKIPHSIKSERIEGVNWKYWWKISISLEFLRNLKFAYHYCKENPSTRVFDCLTINMWLKGYNCQQSVNKNQTQAADWWKLENRIRFVIWNRNLLDSKNIQIVLSSK